MVSEDDVVSALLAQYRDVLIEMDTERVHSGGQPEAWNLLLNRMQELHLRLRESQAGRDGITELIHDDNLTVRAWSAVNALAWAPEIARAELQRQVERGEGFVAFEAKITLREFDAGRLNTHWQPKNR